MPSIQVSSEATESSGSPPYDTTVGNNILMLAVDSDIKIDRMLFLVSIARWHY